MRKDKKEAQSSYLRVFSLLVDIIWVFAVVGLVVYLIMCFVMIARSGGDKNFMVQTGISLSGFLNSIIFVLIIFYLRKILRSIKAKSPFEVANVQYIKNIAYAVFVLIPINIIGKILIQGFESTFSSAGFIDLVLDGFFKLLIIGLGILVIGKVFESGLELQKEKNLTI